MMNTKLIIGDKMKKVKWCFDGTRVFNGFTDGSKWNGFHNIWVDKKTHKMVSKLMIEELIHSDCDHREKEDWENMKPNNDGLYSYANCYTTQIVDEISEEMSKDDIISNLQQIEEFLLSDIFHVDVDYIDNDVMIIAIQKAIKFISFNRQTDITEDLKKYNKFYGEK